MTPKDIDDGVRYLVVVNSELADSWEAAEAQAAATKQRNAAAAAAVTASLRRGFVAAPAAAVAAACCCSRRRPATFPLLRLYFPGNTITTTTRAEQRSINVGLKNELRSQ